MTTVNLGNTQAAGSAGRGPNADRSELGKFDALSSRFWDPRGEFKPLHMLNPVRARFVADRAKLSGARVLDVGCGGGLLSETLAAEGAQVTGIDLAPGMIEVSRLHAMERGVAIDYRLMSAEALLEEEVARGATGGAGSTERGSPSGVGAPGYDVVTCMEMLEHVPDPEHMLGVLARLTRPGGFVFISTLNRNLKSFLMAIVGAEYLLKLIPKGTHEYERLIRPAELARWGRGAGLDLRDLAGIEYNPLTERCKLTTDPSVNYIACFAQ